MPTSSVSIGAALGELNLEGVFTQSDARVCMVYGIPPIPPYVPDALILCLPYTGAASLTANTTYDYWAAMCR